MTEGQDFTMPKQPRKKLAQKTRRDATYARLVQFPQVRGRTVEKVELSLDSDFHCISIRFKDNTDLTVVIDTTLTFRAEYSKWKAGNQTVLKRWATVRSHNG
jgi:hypothetical protein